MGSRYAPLEVITLENTKQIIIEKALILFADRGYEGISMRDIASAVGIKAASLYNHFKSKEEIFNSIIDEMSRRYQERAVQAQMPQGDMDAVVVGFMQVDDEMLTAMARDVFLYFLRDDFAARFRRLLTMEQYRSTKAREVYQMFFIDGALNFQQNLFEQMMSGGAFIHGDPAVMALHFYAPIFLLLEKYDLQPEREAEALEMLGKLVRQFSVNYGNKIR